MKAIKKGDLPEKICVTCNRPFSWRKKMGEKLVGSKIL